MPAGLLSRSEAQSKVESKVNSYLDESVGNLLWAGMPMEVLRNDKLIFEVPVMCTLNEKCYKVGTVFVDVNTTELIQELSDSPPLIKENIRDLVEMK